MPELKLIRVAAFDPSLNNSAGALIEDLDRPGGGLKTTTVHFPRLEAGMYSNALKQWNADTIDLGLVEDFSNVGGKDTNKNAIKSVSQAGGRAEEAIVAAGIPMLPIDIKKWRKVSLGQAPRHPTKSGRVMRYFTKGDSKFKVPGNVAPALLNLFRYQLELEKNYSPEKFFSKGNPPPELIPWTYEQGVKYVAEHIPVISSRRIQIVFGKSLDELEAAGIAYAGYQLLKSGQIEGM